MFVGCKLPHGLTVDHLNETITLNGANVGYDADTPWANGAAPDSLLRINGVGLTEIADPKKQEAFKAWFEVAGKGHGPVKSGLIFIVDKRADAEKETQLLEDEKTGLDGLDPSKDLPAGVSTDPETAKGKKKG